MLQQQVFEVFGLGLRLVFQPGAEIDPGKRRDHAGHGRNRGHRYAAGHRARIAAALKPGGRFHIGVKTGTGSARDSLGRFYTYYTEDELTGLLQDAGLTVFDRAEGTDPGLSGVPEHWICLAAHA